MLNVIEYTPAYANVTRLPLTTLTPLLSGSTVLNVMAAVAFAEGTVWGPSASQIEPHRFVTAVGSGGVTVGADKAQTSHTEMVVVPAAVTR